MSATSTDGPGVDGLTTSAGVTCVRSGQNNARRLKQEALRFGTRGLVSVLAHPARAVRPSGVVTVSPLTSFPKSGPLGRPR